jgi:hypothetical protein
MVAPITRTVCETILDAAVNDVSLNVNGQLTIMPLAIDREDDRRDCVTTVNTNFMVVQAIVLYLLGRNML